MYSDYFVMFYDCRVEKKRYGNICLGIMKCLGIYWSLLKEKYVFFFLEKLVVSYNK